MIIFVFFIFVFAFWPFLWQRQSFWKNQPIKAELHMAYDIPTRFHKVWSRHLREICRPNNIFGFLSSSFMKHCRNIHCSMWKLLRGWKQFNMAAVAMVTKVQKMLNPKSEDFCILPFWIQNGRHSKSKWLQCGAACLTSCKYPFPLKF
jgi:hypothetical protein